MKKRYQIFAITFILLGCFFRFFLLTKDGFESDELYTATAAIHRPMASLKDFRRTIIPDLKLNDSFFTWQVADNTPPLLPLMLRAWSKIFGISDLALKSLGALLACLSLFIFYFGLKGPLGEKAAILGVAILGFSQPAIMYAQILRGYGLALFFCAIAVIRLIQYVVYKKEKIAWVDVFIFILLSFSHYTGFFTSGILAALYFFFIVWPNRQIKEIFKFLLVPALIFPWLRLTWTAFSFSNTGGMAWRDFGTADILPLMIPQAIDVLLPGVGFLFVIIWVASFVSATYGRDFKSRLKDPVILLSLAFIGVFILQFVYSIYNAFHSKMWHQRYFIVSLPIIYGSLVLLFSKDRFKNVVPIVGTGLILLFSSVKLCSYYGPPMGEQYREGSQFIQANASQDSLIIMTWAANAAYYDHYLKQYMDLEKQKYMPIIVSDEAEVKQFCAQNFKPGQQIFLFNHATHRKYFDMVLSECSKKGIFLEKEQRFIGVDVYLFKIPKVAQGE